MLPTTKIPDKFSSWKDDDEVCALDYNTSFSLISETHDLPTGVLKKEAEVRKELLLPVHNDGEKCAPTCNWESNFLNRI